MLHHLLSLYVVLARWREDHGKYRERERERDTLFSHVCRNSKNRQRNPQSTVKFSLTVGDTLFYSFHREIHFCQRQLFFRVVSQQLRHFAFYPFSKPPPPPPTHTPSLPPELILAKRWNFFQPCTVPAG